MMNVLNNKNWMNFSVLYIVSPFACVCVNVFSTITSFSTKCIHIDVLKSANVQCSQRKNCWEIQNESRKAERGREIDRAKNSTHSMYWISHYRETVQQQQNKNTTRSNAKNTIHFTPYNDTAIVHRTYGCLTHNACSHVFFLALFEKSNDERGKKLIRSHSPALVCSLSYSHYKRTV